MTPAPTDKAAIFRISNLSNIYRNSDVAVRALNDVTPSNWEGEMTVLLGPSGSGKSTFLNIVGGLDRATSGRVLFRERDLTACSERQLTKYRRDHVGFVFQFST